jgi:hypothetical protein
MSRAAGSTAGAEIDGMAGDVDVLGAAAGAVGFAVSTATGAGAVVAGGGGATNVWYNVNTSNDRAIARNTRFSIIRFASTQSTGGTGSTPEDPKG